ncbi:MAG: hypothetical protein ABIH17_12715 [Pseudomonadota bacterium]
MHFTPALLLELIAFNWPRARQLVKDPAAETVARHVHNEVLRILRSAESMARCMLLILALNEPVAPALSASKAKVEATSPTVQAPPLPAKAETKAASPRFRARPLSPHRAPLAQPTPPRLARLIARLRGARTAGRIARHAPVRPRLIMPSRYSRSLDRLTQVAIAYVRWGAEAALSGAWESG